jgi:serine/threonine protein kinase
MGLVFAARDEQLDRDVAVKILRCELAGSRRGRGTLLREAQSMARLSHPNVGQVYDVGYHAGKVFIAMELIRGQTLRKWCAKRNRSWGDVVRMFVLAGEGLAAAHAAGLVHSDFKPDNVLVGDDGRPRVIDFGLARPACEITTEPNPTERQPDTDSACDRTIAGTVPYMPPEQRDGGYVDARADQFAFCVSLFEMLYRRRPFGASNRQRRPLVDFKARGVPRAVHRAILRGLAWDPAQRFTSLGDLLDELRAHAVKESAWTQRLLAIVLASPRLQTRHSAILFLMTRASIRGRLFSPDRRCAFYSTGVVFGRPVPSQPQCKLSMNT